MAAKKQEAPTLDLGEDERAPATPEAQERYPSNPDDWRSRHYLSVLARIERAWDVCPPAKRPILRAMVLDLVGGEQKGGAA
jgi:hypothetical protein